MKKLWMLTVLTALTAAAAAQDQAETTLTSTAEGRLALAEARSVADMVAGLEGEARLAALQRAAQAYEQVATDHARDSATCARANFEAAELWRRHGSLAVAEKAYARAAELDPGRYAERGLIEAAHMQRRLDQVEMAHDTYVKVAAIDPTSTRAHEARLWIGRTLDSLEKPDEAIAAYRHAVEAAGRPRHSIEACNLLAKALVAAGDLDGAAAAIATAEKAVEAAMLKGESGADSLKKALDEMSARNALQRARDKKGGAYQDARALERKRGGSPRRCQLTPIPK